jgi:hypothetical protein
VRESYRSNSGEADFFCSIRFLMGQAFTQSGIMLGRDYTNSRRQYCQYSGR